MELQPLEIKWPDRDQVVKSSCFEFFTNASFTDIVLASEGNKSFQNFA
jgi:hypothetical protein